MAARITSCQNNGSTMVASCCTATAPYKARCGGALSTQAGSRITGAEVITKGTALHAWLDHHACPLSLGW